MQVTFEAMAYNHPDEEVKKEVMETLQTKYNMEKLQQIVVNTLIKFKDAGSF